MSSALFFLSLFPKKTRSFLKNPALDVSADMFVTCPAVYDSVYGMVVSRKVYDTSHMHGNGLTFVSLCSSYAVPHMPLTVQCVEAVRVV